jgi:hypothetical protein
MQTVTPRDPGGREWTLARSWIAPRWRGRLAGDWDLRGVDLTPIPDDSLGGLLIGICLVLLLTVGALIFVAVLWPLLLLLVELAVVVPLVFLRRYRLTALGPDGGSTAREVRGWRRSREELRTAVARVERGDPPFAA